MEVGPSDVPEQSCLSKSNISIEEVVSDLKSLLKKQVNASPELHRYLNLVEKQMSEDEKNRLSRVDQEAIKLLVEKHPYFKNPSTYHIRLITIMKYLKKKGVDISIKDIDLLVDEIILSIDGVERISYGKYKRKRF